MNDALKGPVCNILAGFMIFILVTAQHVAHEYFIKSTYLQHNKSNLVCLAFRKVLMLTRCMKLYTVQAAFLQLTLPSESPLGSGPQYCAVGRASLKNYTDAYVENVPREEFSQRFNQGEDNM